MLASPGEQYITDNKKPPEGGLFTFDSPYPVPSDGTDEHSATKTTCSIADGGQVITCYSLIH